MTLTDAQVKRVQSLEDPDGRVTPDQVVEDAKKKSSPLHALFEWDKAAAAEIYWKARAREVIGAVYIVVTTQHTVLKQPVYVRDPEAVGQGYRSAMELRKDPEQARESLIYTLEVAAGHLRRAMDLAEPLGLSGEIDALIRQVMGVQKEIKTAA